MKRSYVRRAGFTLIELLIVIAILVGLSALGVVAYTKIKAGADVDSTKVLVKNTAHAVQIFYTNMNRYPTSDAGLKELIDPPAEEKDKEKWKGPYLEDGRIPVDPWGNELKYQLIEDTSGTGTGTTYHVWSLGPDGQDGTNDDIKSWSEETNK